jgi:hypothetical protein
VSFGEHVLELSGHIVHFALRLRAGVTKTILRGED